ncbi:MAG TPA: endonuclease/exonuclease/phosphatase family protein [Pyrinomonadaceae bacterium]|nr:endonuclease/exonuclease/phosphatase family protein [Pyrinomonadaceae bacterium]
MTARRPVFLFALIPVLILVGFVKAASAQNIVLYASQAPVKAGNWSAVADSTAAGSARLGSTDFGAGKITTPKANPTDYVELNFYASAGIPYRLWMRGKATNNSPYNDSVFIQFSGSVNSSGSAVYRIGTTSATEYNLEDCSGCTLSGWGWQDNGWGTGVLGPQIFFQSTGTQTIRIQVREDGLSIDQVVLSASTYLYSSPGSLKNDGIILAPFDGLGGQLTESANNTRLPPATQIIDSTGAIWTRTATGSILRNSADTGGTGSEILYCNRVVYVFGTDSQWYKWTGGWVAVGAVDPCSGTTSSLTESTNNTRLPPATQIVDSALAVWTISNGAILRNGGGTGGLGSQILYCNRVVYVFGTDSQWYKWTGGWVAVGAVDPCSGTTSLTESTNNTRLPPATQIVDSALAVWTISNGAILRNGAGTSGTGSQILYCNRTVYVFGSDWNWWRWANGWIFYGALDPCGSSTPTPTPTPVNQPPTLSISATPTSGNSPLFVTFASSASDADGYIAGYSWNLGNGVTSSVPNPTNTYASAGTYTATLTVVDNSGATATRSVQISVSSPPASSSLRVLSWNVAFGTGTDGVRTYDRTAQYIANMNPDIAGLCEIPSDAIGTLVNALQQKTGRTWYWTFRQKYDGTTEGNLIISKYSFVSTGGRYLSYQRSVAQATINVGGRTINFFATHLDPDSSGVRYTQVGELMSYASGFSESRMIVGDFNAGPDTSESVRMTSTYYDSWVRAMNAGTAVAYPDNPVYLHTRTRRGRIDYVYYSLSSPHLVLQGTQVPDTRNLSQTNVVVTLGTLDDKGVRPSDHNPMIANFTIQ